MTAIDRRHLRAWRLLVGALAPHVLDEALTGFLDFYNPLVLSIRARYSAPACRQRVARANDVGTAVDSFLPLTYKQSLINIFLWRPAFPLLPKYSGLSPTRRAARFSIC